MIRRRDLSPAELGAAAGRHLSVDDIERYALAGGYARGRRVRRRTIPAAPTSERLRFSESLFFQFDVGVEVDLRGIHGLMPKPELRSSASADQGGRPASVAGLQDAD